MVAKQANIVAPLPLTWACTSSRQILQLTTSSPCILHSGAAQSSSIDKQSWGTWWHSKQTWLLEPLPLEPALLADTWSCNWQLLPYVFCTVALLKEAAFTSSHGEHRWHGKQTCLLDHLSAAQEEKGIHINTHTHIYIYLTTYFSYKLSRGDPFMRFILYINKQNWFGI